MGEYMFGLGTGQLTDEARARIDKIAARYDCTINNPNVPGEGYRYWLVGPNRGQPFDQRMVENVWGALESAGLADDEGLTAECFADTGEVDT